MAAFTYSDEGLTLTKYCEKCRLVAYDDVRPNYVLQPHDTVTGTLTIGYGHTGKDVFIGLVWTQEQADEALQHDVNASVIGVNKIVDSLNITQKQFDALVDFAFNLGLHALETSTLITFVKYDDMLNAANEFPKWCHFNGKENTFLYKRRLAERQLFLNSVYTLNF